MKIHTLDWQLWLPAPIDTVFPFFANARNLDLLTPASLHFRILNPGPITMAAGTRIAYRIKVRGIPMRWESEITVWEPQTRFVDDQIRGPYRYWSHDHRFDKRDGGTDVTDRVSYAVPGGTLANFLFVARNLRNIFEYRRQKLIEIFAKQAQRLPGLP